MKHPFVLLILFLIIISGCTVSQTEEDVVPAPTLPVKAEAPAVAPPKEYEVTIMETPFTFAGIVNEAIDTMQKTNPSLEIHCIKFEQTEMILSFETPITPANPASNPYSYIQETVSLPYDSCHVSREDAIFSLAYLSLPTLSELYAENWPAEDLTLLEGFPLLRVIYVPNKEEMPGLLSDISTAASLPELMRFHADGNQIHDLSPLAQCEKLYSMVMDHNLIEDVSDLAGHTALIHVSLSYNQIKDATPLTDLSSFDGLSSLNLCGNPLERVSPDLPVVDDADWEYFDFELDLDETPFANLSQRNVIMD